MATGDVQDILARLRSYLPRKWFGDFSSTPIINGVLTGIASGLAIAYTLIQFAWAQTRLATSSGNWVDLWAADFFGSNLPRNPNESDAAYIARIRAQLFIGGGTRPAMVSALTKLTGKAPRIIELTRPSDTGAYGAPFVGYGCSGAYGSLLLPYQAFVQVQRQTSGGLSGVGGYGSPAGGYSEASRLEYADLAMLNNSANDADLYAAIASAKAAGTALWVNVSNDPITRVASGIDVDFVIGTSSIF